MQVIFYLICVTPWGKKRVDHDNKTTDFQCRKTNNLKMIPDNKKHCYGSLPNDHTPECIKRLAQIGLIKNIYLIDDIPTGNFDSNHNVLQPTRHIPYTNPTHDRNMSYVEGCIFFQLTSI